MSSIYKLRNFEKKKITIEDIKSVHGVVVVKESKECFGVPTSLYFISNEEWENKFSLEIGFNQGLVYGFIRYDDNHEKASNLISFLSEKLKFDFFEINS
tara:strand:- start:59 stop:355 length:297 start_codon:yes stop_codon:yes gene_type:complete